MQVVPNIFVSIIVVYVLVVISPGPNFVVVTRYATKYPITLAFAVTLGIAIGAIVNASLTMFGIGALMLEYQLFAITISIIGGGLLLYLGISTIYHTIIAIKKSKQVSKTARTPQKLEVHTNFNSLNLLQLKPILSACSKGFLLNLFNPKGIAFFIGLYAPLITKVELVTKFTVLAICFLIELVWYSTVILLLARSSVRHVYDRIAVPIDFLLGISLIIFSFLIFGKLNITW